MRVRVRSLASPSGLRIWYGCDMWCRSPTRLGSDVAVAVVEAGSCSSHMTPSLGTSICCRCSPKKKRKRKKKKPKKQNKEFKPCPVPGIELVLKICIVISRLCGYYYYQGLPCGTQVTHLMPCNLTKAPCTSFSF